ncbi:hypothetical protein CC86DRAFT_318193 [Ophiobolus disseminans]|uniref:Knr4/Smi1-like domain-containing protein n=1 Tax=Ophiobolus disseminans TaxID=1469910 RepID=A0A6A7A7H6_9PLEO|nr:hypothetical protein CC86DRAFT_318193 [Ophiobolus disseminans]
MATSLPLIPWSKTSILTERMHLYSSRIAQYAALDLFVLGFPRQASMLLEAIREYGLDTKTRDYYGWTTEAQFQRAWGASSTFPLWQSMQDGPDSDDICDTGLPKEIAKKARNKTLRIEDVDFVRKRMNAEADSVYRNPEKTVTLGAVINVAILADEKLLATKLVEDDIKGLYQHLQEEWNDPFVDGEEQRTWLAYRQGFEHCPSIFQMLREAKLGESLGVCEIEVDAFVKEGCALIKKRSIKGPARPYASKTMAELVQLISDNILANCALAEDDADAPSTLLKPGATEDQITALENRLSTSRAEDDPEDTRVMLPGKQLPDDYKDFLRTSNGIVCLDVGEEGGYSFSPTDEVTTEGAWMHDMEYTLFPSCDPNFTYGEDKDFDNIPLGEYACFTIGTGDGEGNVTLIPPESVTPIIERFEKAYAEANDQNRKVYERAALDLYGGVEQLRKLEWLCIEFQHSAYEQRIWGGLRPYLEEYLQRSVDDVKKAERVNERYRREKEKKEAEKKEFDDAKAGGKRTSDGVDDVPGCKAQRTQ